MVGTYQTNRKHSSKELAKVKHDCEFYGSFQVGIISTKWIDTKEVCVLSNCHKPELGIAKRKNKSGDKIEVMCPKMITDYNRYMAGTDRCDQMATMYMYDRKSNKWWKKVTMRLFRIAILNTWIIISELKKKKEPLINLLDELALEMISDSVLHLTPEKQNRRKVGRPTNREKMIFDPIGQHLPVHTNQRRRCVGCAKLKKDRRVHFICRACDEAYCSACFAPCHDALKASVHKDNRTHGSAEDSQDDEVVVVPTEPQRPVVHVEPIISTPASSPSVVPITSNSTIIPTIQTVATTTRATRSTRRNDSQTVAQMDIQSVAVRLGVTPDVALSLQEIIQMQNKTYFAPK